MKCRYETHARLLSQMRPQFKAFPLLVPWKPKVCADNAALVQMIMPRPKIARFQLGQCQLEYCVCF